LISFEGIYLNLILNRHEVLFKNTFLPALIYVVLMSFNPGVIRFNEILIVNLLLIFTCEKIFSLFKNESPAGIIFDCGLLISVTSLIYFPVIILLLFLLIVLIIQRAFSLREWTIAVVAFLLPYFFLFTYSFLLGSLKTVVAETTAFAKLNFITYGSNAMQLPQFVSQERNSVLLFAIFFGIQLLLSLIRLRTNYYKNTIKTRSAQQVIIMLTLFIIAEILFVKKMDLAFFAQLAIPFSTFIAYYYVSGKKRLWLFETSFWIMIALIFSSYFSA
jgi:hypothetical protein